MKNLVIKMGSKNFSVQERFCDFIFFSKCKQNLRLDLIRQFIDSVDSLSSWVLPCQKNKRGYGLNFYQKIWVLDIIKPKRKENLQSQLSYQILSLEGIFKLHGLLKKIFMKKTANEMLAKVTPV